MGQGTSTLRRQHQQEQNGRSRRVDSVDPDAMDTDENVNASATGSPSQARQPRRSRRIRDSVAQLGERIMRAGIIPGSVRSTGASTGLSQENATSPQLRHRVRFLASRSASPRADAPVVTQRNGRPRSPVNTGIESGADIVHPNLHLRQSNDIHDHTMSGVTSTEDVLTRSSQDAEVQTTNASSSIGGEAPATPRRSRMSRVRSSLSSNLPNLLAELGNTSRFSANSSRRTSQLRNSQYDDPYDLEDDMDMDDHASLGSGEGSRNTRSGRSGFGSLDDGNAMDLLENPRVRPGEDQAAMLSRLLSVAAAMTAASLVGNSEQALTEAQDVAGDTVDGSFESFLRALQNGRLAAALRNGGNEMGGGMSADNNTNDGAPPLNFFRMFRFGASATDSFNANNPPSEGDTPPSRMIPVIIVGIRSVSPRENNANTQAQDNNNAPFLEQLASSIPPLNGPISSRSGLRNRLSSAANRRASMGSPAVDIPRSPRRTRPVSDILSPTLTSVADTPQGPYPPPSTPAEPAMAATSTVENPVIPPSRSARTAHADTPRPTRRHSTPHFPANGARNEASSEGTNGRPGAAANGSGSERGARSWIIYVLGGSYPENHPILTTPSLFTDSPTYEDMMLLSSLLGPAKPPVASRDDIDQAGGLFTIGDTSKSTSSVQFRLMPEGERCLVCLGDYEDGEVCRSLTKCSHIFHKDCIDTWLTTGRNSCPLCRGQGVQEKDAAPATEQPPAAPAAEAVPS